MNDRTAFDGRYQLIKISDECWTLICDGAPQISIPDRAVANEAFQMILRAHEIGRRSAFSDVRQLIGAAHAL